MVSLLASGEVRRLLGTSMLARLPSAMLPLSILLLVVQSGGSIAEAGVVVGAYGIGRAVASPVAGALVDGFGQAPVLVAGAAAQAVALGFVVAVVWLRAAPTVIALMAVIAGATQPPVQACLRALWPVVVRDSQRDAAYSFDATSQELIWIAGPLLVAVILGLGSAAAAVAVSAVVAGVGIALFVASAPSRREGGGKSARTFAMRGLGTPGVRVLVGISICTGLAWGAMTLGLSALAVSSGNQRASGVLLASLGAGSIAGGLAYGSRRWRAGALARMRALLGAGTLLAAPLVLARSVVVAAPLTFFAGLPLAPTYAVAYVLTGAAAPRRSTTEAFTWTSSAFALGVALGTGAGGVLVQAAGNWSAFALAAASPLLACVLTWLPGLGAPSEVGIPAA